MTWFQLDVKTTFDKLNTSVEGLKSEETERRLKVYGPNKIAEEKGFKRIEIVINQFKNPLIYILIIAALITIILHEYIDAGVIITVVILNAVVGYIQEYKAEQSAKALKKLMVIKARVIRNSKEMDINSEDLVPGDIVLLASGSRVPADLRLFRSFELKIDESMLTGESVPAEKVSLILKENSLSLGDQRNIAFMGTFVVFGRGRGVVVNTGSNTTLGKIAKEVKEIGYVKTPLQEKFDRFAKIIGLIVLIASISLFVTGLLMGESIKDMFMVAVAAAVATIPEGLPIVVTVAMAIGVARMTRKHAILPNLPAVETLGSTTVICSDKTGTLTKNEMTVRLVYDGRHRYEVKGTGYEPKGEILHGGLTVGEDKIEQLKQVLRIGLLCNESTLTIKNDHYSIEGDPTEGALIVSAIKGNLNPDEEKKNFQLISSIPFESDRAYMATLHKHGDKKVIFIKGSLEKIIQMCTECMVGNKSKLDKIQTEAHEYATEGLRVLAFAYKYAPLELEELTANDVEHGLIFVGLQGMIDPPRPEVINAVQRCKNAGIRVVMITGDHAITAVTIAKKLGIVNSESEVLKGKDLDVMSDEELYKKVKMVSIYARVSPHQKHRIVQQLVNHGEVVAVTGDGVNDAPALKAAHIGVSMGKTGTDVAKEASDMILADDNFATIVSAVEEGRVVYDNIRKVVFFLIPTGIAAILSIIMTMILGLPIPYVAAQLLWINLVTNGLQDVALAFEPGEKDILKRPPRDSNEGIMSRTLIRRTIIVASLISIGVVFNFNYAINSGASLEHARAVAVTTMVFFQFFQAWNSRSEKRSVFKMNPKSNPILLFSLIAAFFAQLAFLYVPVFQIIFRTVALSAGEWLNIIAISSTVIIVVEIDKWLIRNKKK